MQEIISKIPQVRIRKVSTQQKLQMIGFTQILSWITMSSEIEYCFSLLLLEL